MLAKYELATRRVRQAHNWATTGGAWVGTASKLDGEVAAISSKHFFGYQLPASPEVADAVHRVFE